MPELEKLRNHCNYACQVGKPDWAGAFHVRSIYASSCGRAAQSNPRAIPRVEAHIKSGPAARKVKIPENELQSKYEVGGNEDQQAQNSSSSHTRMSYRSIIGVIVSESNTPKIYASHAVKNDVEYPGWGQSRGL